jgi:hypothetical protein
MPGKAVPQRFQPDEQPLALPALTAMIERHETLAVEDANGPTQQNLMSCGALHP